MEHFRKNALDILLGHMHKFFFSNFTLNHMMSFSREREASCLSPGLPLRRKFKIPENYIETKLSSCKNALFNIEKRSALVG